MVASSPDLFQRGLDYLYQIRTLAIDPDLISLVYDLNHRSAICTWIGGHIDSINARLNACLQVCHSCFHPWQQRPMQIFAAPFDSEFGLDGLCNLQTEPITILVDVGRVEPQDWLALVVHEYAHAHLASPGHHSEFAAVLTHLCLGLGLPLSAASTEAAWRSLPHYRSTANSIQFWQGLSTPWFLEA